MSINPAPFDYSANSAVVQRRFHKFMTVKSLALQRDEEIAPGDSSRVRDDLLEETIGVAMDQFALAAFGGIL